MGLMDRAGLRWGALGGVVGPAAFIGAWAVLGTRAAGYSPIENPISRLAAVDAPTRVAMTGGFVAFAAGVALYATEASRAISPATALAAGATAVATLGVGALPLGSDLGDMPHAIAAGSAYTALALTPIAGGAALRRSGRTGLARVSVAVGLTTGALLAASASGTSMTGLLQRAGLTLGDIWIATTAIAVTKPSRLLNERSSGTSGGAAPPPNRTPPEDPSK